MQLTTKSLVSVNLWLPGGKIEYHHRGFMHRYYIRGIGNESRALGLAILKVANNPYWVRYHLWRGMGERD